MATKPPFEQRGDNKVVVPPVRWDKYQETKWVIEALAPRRRDFLQVLLGRYEPRLRCWRPLGIREVSDTVRRVWMNKRLTGLLNQKSSFLEKIDEP